MLGKKKLRKKTRCKRIMRQKSQGFYYKRSRCDVENFSIWYCSLFGCPPTMCFSFNVESNHVKQSHSKLNARNNLSFTPISLCHSCQKKIMSKLHRSEHFCFLKLDELFFWWSVNRLDIFLIRPLCRHGIFCGRKTPTASSLYMYGGLHDIWG